jgi:hypothetical protein
MPISGVVPVSVRPGLETGLIQLEGQDPRLGRGPAGLAGLNVLHDLYARRRPSMAGAVRFEGDDTGRFRLTAPESEREALLGALSDLALDPVVAAGYRPGYGEFDTSYGGPVYRHYGYQTPTGEFRFVPTTAGVLARPTQAAPPGVEWHPGLGQYVYAGTAVPAPESLLGQTATQPFTPPYQVPTAGTAVPQPLDYGGGLLAIPLDPQLFALHVRYAYGGTAPVLSQYRTPAPPPPPPPAPGPSATQTSPRRLVYRTPPTTGNWGTTTTTPADYPDSSTPGYGPPGDEETTTGPLAGPPPGGFEFAGEPGAEGIGGAEDAAGSDADGFGPW